MNIALELLNQLYQSFGILNVPTYGDLAGIISILTLVLCSVTLFLLKPSVEIEKESLEVEQEVAEKIELPKTPTVSWTERLKNGLSRSRDEVWGKIDSIFSSSKENAEIIEELEELLYGADLGPGMVDELMSSLNNMNHSAISANDFKKLIFDFFTEKMGPVQSKVDHSLYNFEKEQSHKTKVIMVVGVNGAGKTTTIGKLATKLTNQGAKVVVGACDTFRAAAVDQLAVWCERSGAEMVRAKEGSNPSGVGYSALEKAINEKADYCILDTAGRLHTKGKLMDELSKSKRVLSKLDEAAPHHVLLVIDAITGNNAVKQAEEFNRALSLTGLILTKCDGSSKAGSAVGIVNTLQVPIAYVGVGESVEDLDIFNQDEYLKTLLDYSENITSANAVH